MKSFHTSSKDNGDQELAGSKIYRFILIVLVLIVLGGLYAFSGMPMPFSMPTPLAYERAKMSKYLALARLTAQTESDDVSEIISRLPIKTNGTVGSFENESFLIFDPPVNYDIIILEKAPDETEMLYAVTIKGKTIKIYTDDIRKSEKH